MTVRKLMLTSLLAVAGVLAFTADAHAFGKRKKNRGGCNDCGSAAPAYSSGCGGCGSSYAAGYAMGGYGAGYAGCGGCSTAWAGMPAGVAMTAPDAMPAAGTATTTQPGAVVPASGTTGGTVVPATGTVVPQSSVLPAGGYYLQNGQYIMPAGGYYQGGNYITPAGFGYDNFQGGFGSGVVQGALGVPNYFPYGGTLQGTVGNSVGRSVGRGIFRR